ncbi:MAG TPA: hypothetical protein VMY43_00525 [Methanothrix sp.]|nr:hypothetical protein [Methanothrix sp.]
MKCCQIRPATEPRPDGTSNTGTPGPRVGTRARAGACRRAQGACDPVRRQRTRMRGETVRAELPPYLRQLR